MSLASYIAGSAFADKKDKAGKPYISHLESVAAYVLKYIPHRDDRTEFVDTAYLHDLIEDCEYWSIQNLKDVGFNENVLKAVDLLTKTKNQNYDEYIQNISENRIATAVKLADLEDNMDLVRLPVLMPHDIERTVKYHKAYLFLREKLESLNLEKL